MRLNPDCVRDVLLFLEENLQLSPELEYIPVSMRTIADAVHYPLPEVVNTLVLLEEADFLNAMTDYSNGKILIYDVWRLTYDGHQFLDTIRPKTVWEKVSGACSSAGLYSLDFIKQVAVQVIATIIPTLL